MLTVVTLVGSAHGSAGVSSGLSDVYSWRCSFCRGGAAAEAIVAGRCGYLVQTASASQACNRFCSARTSRARLRGSDQLTMGPHGGACISLMRQPVGMSWDPFAGLRQEHAGAPRIDSTYRMNKDIWPVILLQGEPVCINDVGRCMTACGNPNCAASAAALASIHCCTVVTADISPVATFHGLVKNHVGYGTRSEVGAMQT
jgi:hypothetical protein